MALPLWKEEDTLFSTFTRAWHCFGSAMDRNLGACARSEVRRWNACGEFHNFEALG